jgi:hypothetical protein
VRAKVHKHRLAQRQAIQAKGNRENRYEIKVMRLKQGRGYGSGGMYQAFSLVINNVSYIILILS